MVGSTLVPRASLCHLVCCFALALLPSCVPSPPDPTQDVDAAPGQSDSPIIFTPDARIADVVSDWAVRWSAATGRDIRIGAGGIPVLVVEDSFYTDGEQRCAGAKVQWRGDEFHRAVSVEIDVTPPPDCFAWGYSVGHEMGHALGARYHAEAGLLAERGVQGVVHVIDEAALELVCEHLYCAAFVPES